MFFYIYIMENNEFIKICEGSVSMLQASKKMGLSFSHFKRIAIRLGCYKPNQNWRKGNSSFSDPRIGSKHSLFCENSSARRDYIKGLIIKHNLIDYECLECGISSEWNNKALNLQIDHINGIRNDNRLENLRFLCPNCHSQTDTWCSKNNNFTVNSITIDLLKSIIKDSYSITEVIRRFGFCDTKSNRMQINKIIIDNNLTFLMNQNLNNIEKQRIEKKDRIHKKCKCGNLIQNRSERCKICKSLNSRKVERPDYETLKRDIDMMGFVSTGKKYNVSDNSIRKWIKSYESNRLGGGTVDTLDSKPSSERSESSSLSRGT